MYSDGKTVNVIVSLFELEAAAAMLGGHAIALDGRAERWRRFSALIGRVMGSGGKLQIQTDGLLRRIRPGTSSMVPLPEAPEEIRRRIFRTLDFFASRNCSPYEESSVELFH